MKRNAFIHVLKNDKELFTIRNVKVVDGATIYLEFEYHDDFVFMDGKTIAEIKGLSGFKRGRPTQKRGTYKYLNDKQKEINAKIAKKLKLYREKSGLNIHDVRKQIGVGPTYMSKLERGQVLMTKDNIEAITKIYNVKPDKCLNLLEEMKKEKE